MTDLADPVGLAQALIRCRSITPDHNSAGDGGAMDLVQDWAEALELRTARYDHNVTPNLHACKTGHGPNLYFAGHTDVVPPGEGWMLDPFAAVTDKGVLYGRGAVDMKGAIACFVAALARTPGRRVPAGLLITGDEEGHAADGTEFLLTQVLNNGHRIDRCIVGEPTSLGWVGDTIKIGRRGSLNATLRVMGVQGHSAYPQLADNPVPRVAAIIEALAATPLDEGTDAFEPSTLAFTGLSAGTGATNVTPADATVRFNIRFTPAHTPESLEAELRRRIAGLGPYELSATCNALPFLAPAGPLRQNAQDAVEAVTGRQPVFSTGGGTSDARFIARHCAQVIELGLVNATMHKVDEAVPVDDLETLTRLYSAILMSA